jgi:hypothetical protein
MTTYLCYVHTPTDATPRLTTIACAGVSEIAASLDSVAREWPNHTEIEVYDGDRRLWRGQVAPRRSADSGDDQPLRAAPA